MITQEELKDKLDYNPKTGIFKWRKKFSNTKDIAGTTRVDSYKMIMINYKYYSSHRLAWLYVYGEFPDKQIDHINRDRSDNRIKNLRNVDQNVNMKNRGISKNNTSGFSGVCWCNTRKVWKATIWNLNKCIRLGQFKQLKDAVEARRKAEKIYNYN